jgi:hypothetical protein
MLRWSIGRILTQPDNPYEKGLQRKKTIAFWPEVDSNFAIQ